MLALVALPVAWVLVTPATADGAGPRADAGHESLWPSPAPAATPAPATDEHSGHTVVEHEQATAEPDRPVGLVLGVFGGVNGAVMLSAAVLRRRERATRRQRQAERSRRRAVPSGGGS